MAQEVEIIIPGNQDVKEVMPAEQNVNILMSDADQNVNMLISSVQNVSVSIPAIQNVNVVAGIRYGPPVLMTGPTATPGYDTCLIEWTTDVVAYHRVKTKRLTTPSGDWVETDWTSEASTNASINVTNLDGEAIMYYYKIQSCTVGDGSNAFNWYPVADGDAYFITTCTSASSIVYSNLNAYKDSFGKLTWLVMEWNTNFVCKEGEVDASFSTGDGAATGNRVTYFHREDTQFLFQNGTYWFMVRNKNMCSEQGDWSFKHYFTIVDGDIDIQWDE